MVAPRPIKIKSFKPTLILLFISVFLSVEFYTWLSSDTHIGKICLVQSPETNQWARFKCFQAKHPEYRAWCKSASIWFMILCLWSIPYSKINYTISLGMLFHSLGDYGLDISKSAPEVSGLNLWFLGSLAMFFTGHCLYGISFSKMSQQFQGSTPRQLPSNLYFMIFVLLGLVLGTFISKSIFATSSVAHIKIPIILLYISAVEFLGYSVSKLIKVVPSSRLVFSVVFGPLFYAISDAIIGYDKFVFSAGVFIRLTWPLYYVGQFMIGTALWMLPNLIDQSVPSSGSQSKKAR